MLYLPVCAPGAGKSVLAFELVNAGLISPDSIVSPDNLRWVLTGDVGNQEVNKRVFEIVDKIVRERLFRGLNVYLDATNLVTRERENMVTLALDLGQEVTIITSTLDDAEILRRNNERSRTVPERAMKRMLARQAQYDGIRVGGQLVGPEFSAVKHTTIEEMFEYAHTINERLREI